MEKIIIVALATSAILMSACSSTPMWRQLGVKPQETQKEMAHCRYQISLAKIDPNEKAAVFKECMYSKGFKYSS